MPHFALIFPYLRNKIIRRIWLLILLVAGLMLATGALVLSPPPVAKAFACGGVPDPAADRNDSIGSEQGGYNALNIARAAEGLATPAMPGNYLSLSKEDKTLFLLNQERSIRGLSNFSQNDLVLGQVTRNHSHVLIDFSIFAHNDVVDDTANTRIVNAPGILGHYNSWGEIIAGAPYISWQMYLWMYQDSSSSWGHRHNILGCFSHAGIGSVDGGAYGNITTVDFINSNGTLPRLAWMLPRLALL